MANVRCRPETGHLYFDFYYLGARCREYTLLTDTVGNRKKMEAVLKKIQTEISLGNFEYSRYFPGSKTAPKFGTSSAQAMSPTAATSAAPTPLFSEFAETWKRDKTVEWRRSYLDSVESIFAAHLIPGFGTKSVGAIDRAAVLAFRTDLAKREEVEEGEEKVLSASTVNRIMGILRQIMDEAAIRYGVVNPCLSIKRLKIKRTDIEPFTIDEVKKIHSKAREDYRNYFTVRFFTAMRSGEVHGLKWKHIDFGRRQILVRETYMQGRTEYTKNDGSQREIDMSRLVFDALQEQQKATGQLSEYVFCNRSGGAIDNKNFNDRVWQPLLRHLSLKQRRPYQMRHTCATLWLAAGENPEWIAKQMGHTTTEMLFRVYSRYVPNLTRKDGSAFDRLVTAAMTTKLEPQSSEPPPIPPTGVNP